MVLGAVIVVQQLEGHVLQPLIMGRAVAIHPLAVIVAIASGVVLAGIMGALVAVPLIAVAQHRRPPPQRTPPRQRASPPGAVVVGSEGLTRSAQAASSCARRLRAPRATSGLVVYQNGGSDLRRKAP